MGTRSGIERIACEDRDPYLWALERILSAVREGRADADLSLESVVEPARLAFECREAYRSELALAPRVPDSR